jgi:hypothetical protein
MSIKPAPRLAYEIKIAVLRLRITLIPRSNFTMKSERFTLFILLVEVVAIGFLHSAKTGKPQASLPKTTVAAEAKQPVQATWQWNNNFTLIRLK